jgi:hypothetical protein
MSNDTPFETSEEELMYLLKATDEFSAKIKKQQKELGWKKGKAANGKGICPICDHIIYWELHSNGHLWAKCETENCINHIE